MAARKIETRCPYCGLKHITMVKFTFQDLIREFVYCHDSYGGCGREYAVLFEMWIKPNVFKLVDPGEDYADRFTRVDGHGSGGKEIR